MSLRKIVEKADAFQRTRVSGGRRISAIEVIPPVACFALAIVNRSGRVAITADNLGPFPGLPSEGGGDEGKTLAAADKQEISLAHYMEVTLSKAQILDLANTAVEILPAPGLGLAISVESAIVVYHFDTAAYEDGGTVYLKWNRGGPLKKATGDLSAANSFLAAGDVIGRLPLLNTDGGDMLYLDNGIMIEASGTFTDPGTAAGAATVLVAYRLYSTGLAA